MREKQEERIGRRSNKKKTIRDRETETETPRQSHRGIRHHLRLRNQRCLRHNGQKERQRQRDRGRDRDTKTKPQGDKAPPACQEPKVPKTQWAEGKRETERQRQRHKDKPTGG